jgi:hypothetical protein
VIDRKGMNFPINTSKGLAAGVLIEANQRQGDNQALG